MKSHGWILEGKTEMEANTAVQETLQCMLHFGWMAVSFFLTSFLRTIVKSFSNFFKGLEFRRTTELSVLYCDTTKSLFLGKLFPWT